MAPVSAITRRLVGWFQGSTNRRILAAILTVGGFAVVVKVTATVKELAVAYRFGTGDALDAFLIAFLIPTLVINVGAASLTPAFTPIYIEVRETQGPIAARRLFASTTAAGVILLLIVTGALILIMPVGLRLLATGFSQQKLALTRLLFLLLLPVVELNAIATMWSAALNAEERFASAA